MEAEQLEQEESGRVSKQESPRVMSMRALVVVVVGFSEACPKSMRRFGWKCVICQAGTKAIRLSVARIYKSHFNRSERGLCLRDSRKHVIGGRRLAKVSPKL